MSVLGRLLISSAERIDLADLLSIDSYVAGDFKFLLKGLVGDSKPFIIKGFDIIDPQNAIGTQSCSIRVADSFVFYPGSSTGSFFHGLEEGHPQAAPLVPELRKNATNFVYATFSTFNSSVDTRAFWDPDKDGGVGGEFTQDVNTESVLKVDINVSTGSFPANTIPIAKIVVGPVVITSITDCRDLMFRLGSGGISPDPFANYQFRSLPNAGYQRSEPPITMVAGGDNPFQGGDKNILSLKEWMDLVMTKFKELSGTTYWYEDLSTYSLISMFIDAMSTTFKSKGQWQHSSATPGLVTWTEDIQIKITQDTRDIILRAGNKTLANEEVAYLNLQRNKTLNSSDNAVSWINGQNYVNTVGGAIGYFANLAKGDWVKKVNDPNHLFLRVEEFYDSVNLGGSTTTAANARSIRLSAIYQGTTGVEKGRYDKGVYQPSDVVVSARSAAPLTTAGGNFHWLVARSDVIEGVGSIDTFTLSGTLSEADGSTAKVTVTAHGLQDGDLITVTAPAAQAGTYKVEVEDANTFYIQTANTTTGVFTAFYGLATTVARDNGYGLQLESANHGFQSGDTVIVAGTTNFNGAYTINKRSATQFQFAFSSDQAAETTGTATLARVNVRSEQGLLKIVQGESTDIGGGASANMKSFIGMKSDNETHPGYFITPGYNTLDGFQNYNSSVADNLTERVSKLTAMMADKSQDRTSRYLPSPSLTTITNTTNGAAQEITFSTAGSTLTIVTPGSDGNATITLPHLAPGISLLQNQVAYVEIDRNNPTTPSIQVADMDECPVGENIFVIAMRLDTTSVYLWEGSILTTGGSPFIPTAVVRQNQVLKLVEGGVWSWDLPSENLTWSDDAFVQIPSLANSVNQILAGSAVLAAGEVAYVDINRVGPGGTLTVTVATAATLTLTTDRIVIARREGNDVIIGAHSTRLMHGEARTLYGDHNKISDARLLDDTSTSLPSGPTATIDGLSVANGDKVLFINLTTVSDRGVYVASGVGSSIVWTKLPVFNGSDLPYDGALVYIKEGASYLHAMWEYDGIDWKRQDNADVTDEATGFPNQTDSEVTFDDGTRTLTIQPTGTSFDYYVRGVRYRKTSAQTVVIPNVEGLYYIYFEGPTLTQTNAFTIDILNKFAYVATVYWDATNASGIMLGDERHGLSLDWATHQYLHTINGTQIDNGFAAGNFTTAGTGSADADVELSIANGRVFDEDIISQVSNNAAPSAPFEQILSPVAEIPVFYRDGASGHWRKNAALSYPLMPGVGGVAAAEVTDITCVAASGITSGQYFNINSANDVNKYSVWYRVDSLGSAPVVVGRTLAMVDILSTDTASQVATKTDAVLNALTGLSSTVLGAVVTVTNDDDGTTTDAANVDVPGLGISVTTQGAEGPLPKYNLFSGGTWTQPNASGNNYIAIWVFATNNIYEPVVALLGQRQDSNLTDAQQNNTYESLSFGLLPSAEMKVLFRLIYQVNTNYTNTVHAALRDVRDLRKSIDTSVGAYAATDHGLLSGLTDQDHPASAIYTDTTNFTRVLSAADDDVQKALDTLDQKAVSSDSTFQDRNMKLVKGGTWAWNSGTNTLSWSANAFIQIPGLAENRNQINAGSASLTADGQVAWVDVNRDAGAPAVLTVQTGAISGMPTDVDRIIIARRNGADVVVGSHSMRLINGESKALDAGVSDQHLSFTGASDNADATPDYAAAVSHTLRYITENTSLEEAISRLDDQLDKLFGQLRLRQATVPNKRIIVTGADTSVLDSTTLSQQTRNLLLNFSGAQIDFETGVVYQSDGITPLGLNFTPAAIGLNQYRWYSVTLVASSVGVDNRIGAQVLVIPATADGASANAAPRAAFASGIKLGQVVVQNSGVISVINNLTQASVVQLGSGSGGGSDGTGDANSILETIKNNLVSSSYEKVTPSIGSQQTDSLIATFGGTASYSIADQTYKFDAASDSITSEDLLDLEEYINNTTTPPTDITKSMAYLSWKSGFIDTAATVSISRDNGVTFAPITMERIGVNTEGFVGEYRWDKEEEVADVTDSFTTNDTQTALTNSAGSASILGSQFSLAVGESVDVRVRSLLVKLSRLGTITGNYRLALYNDSAGNPGSRLYTTAWQSASTVSTSATDYTISLDGNNVYLPDNATYYLVLETDDAYKATTDGSNNLRWHRSSGSGSGARAFGPLIWSTIATSQFDRNIVYTYELFSSLLSDVAASTGNIDLNATTQQAVARQITVAADTVYVAKRVMLRMIKTGTPTGVFQVKIIKDSGGVPSTNASDILVTSANYNVSAVPTSNTDIDIDLSNTVLQSGTYHIVVETDSEYKSVYTGSNKISLNTFTGASISAVGIYNGTTWSEGTATDHIIYRLEGRQLGLILRVVSSAGDKQLDAFAVFYEISTPIGGGVKNFDVKTFLSASDNTTQFAINFIPDPDLLRIYHIETGQVYKYPAFSVSGNVITFATNQFYSYPDKTVTLHFMQTEGSSFDNSDANGALLAGNYLGSLDSSIDRSSPGRGILLRRPDGTLREIALDDNDNIVVYSV